MSHTELGSHLRLYSSIWCLLIRLCVSSGSFTLEPWTLHAEQVDSISGKSQSCFQGMRGIEERLTWFLVYLALCFPETPFQRERD